MAVTDGRIAIVQDGFAFPVEEVLIPTEHLRGMKFLQECTKLEVGSSAKWIHLKAVTGPQRWWVDLKINCDGRFPTIDQCFPPRLTANTEVTISDSDAQFILRELPKALEGDRLEPVTLIAEGTQRRRIRFRFVFVPKRLASKLVRSLLNFVLRPHPSRCYRDRPQSTARISLQHCS